MPHAIRVDDDRSTIVVAMHGEVLCDELLEIVERLLHPPYLSLPYGILLDYRNATLKELTSRDIGCVVKHLEKHRENLRPFNLAILATGDLEFGINRMFQGLVEGDFPFNTFVTRSEEAAIHWATENPNPSANGDLRSS